MDVPAEARHNIPVPSQTAKRYSQIHQSRDLLSGWRTSLTPGEISQILGVVRAFGLDFYSDNLEPDYSRLHGSSPIHVSMFPS
jgi:hypothetical protein